MKSRRVESFLIRIVLEEPAAGPAQPWHGRVQHISSGMEQRFDCLDDLVAALQAQFGDAAAEAATPGVDCGLRPAISASL